MAPPGPEEGTPHVRVNAMDLKEELTRRFTNAVKEYAQVPILIGPKWLQEGPPGSSILFQYHGAPKVAKALGRDRSRVCRGLLKLLDLTDLPVHVSVSGNGVFDITATKDSSTDG